MIVKQTVRGLIAAFIVGICSVSARAWIFEQVPDKAVTVHYRLPVGPSVSTNTILIDLNDTTNFPHKETGELNLDYIRLGIDKLAASTGTVKLGIVNMVNVTTGSVTWMWSVEFSTNASNTNIQENTNLLPVFLKCRVNPASTADIDGSTPYILSNDKTTQSTTYQTDVALPTPVGNAFPGVGDILLQVVNKDNVSAIIVTVDAIYHSNAR